VASDQSSPPTSAAEALEHLGSLSLRKVSMEYLLQTVADLTKAVMHGNPEASVTLLVKDHPTTVATTGQLALDLDEQQYECGHGPCLHAARTGELTEIDDMRTDSRWPDYSPRAVESGALSSLSVPLAIDVDEQVTGATHFGPYAAIAAGDLHAFQSTRARADNLQAALATRGVIDQAKGILMDRHKLTADQAFQVLAQTSMKTNRKLYAVADELVHTGDLPTGNRSAPPD
jgi:hypothetical protein